MTVIAERGWRCLNLGCPTREPVRAEDPPKCYTCGRAMAAVHAPVIDPGLPGVGVAVFASARLGAPWVDLGANPTREQLLAAGFETDSERYRKDLETFRSTPEDLVEPLQWNPVHDVRARVDHVALVERAPDPHAIMRLPERAFPYGYDVSPTSRGTEVHLEIEHHLDAAAARTRGLFDSSNAYRCTRAGCPVREPVRASSPPTCYTCQQPMSEVAEFTRPALALVSGVAEMVEAMQRRIAAVFDMPLTLLLGHATAGLGGRPVPARHAGDSDDFSPRGTERDRIRRQEYDLAQLRSFGRRPGEQHRPVGVPTTLDGERISVRDSYYVPDGGVRLLVPRGDADFWQQLAAYGTFPQEAHVRSYHTIEWPATANGPGLRAEFQAIESVRRVAGGRLEVCFRRLRPNLRPEEIYPVLGPDMAVMRDEAATPEARLAAARRLFDAPMFGEPRFDDLHNEIRACLTGLPTWWCACERAVIRAGAAEVELLLDQDRGFVVQVTPAVRDWAWMSEHGIADTYGRAARAALPDDVAVSVQLMRQPLLDDPQENP